MDTYTSSFGRCRRAELKMERRSGTPIQLYSTPGPCRKQAICPIWPHHSCTPGSSPVSTMTGGGESRAQLRQAFNWIDLKSPRIGFGSVKNATLAPSDCPQRGEYRRYTSHDARSAWAATRRRAMRRASLLQLDSEPFPRRCADMAEWGSARRCLVVPPFLFPFSRFSQSGATRKFRDWFGTRSLVGIAESAASKWSATK